MDMMKLIEFGDKKIREEVGDYYIVSKSRLENILQCLETGKELVKELSATVAAQQEEIARLAGGLK